MDANTIYTNSRTLIIFLDETGNEDFSDPRNPTFGRGGCAVLGDKYRNVLKKPWRQLKRNKLGGANKPFHATDFEQSKPEIRQIQAINNFLSRPFWRFAVMSDIRTNLPQGIDAHRAISLITIQFIERLSTQYDIDRVALVFESSERGDSLVKRDFNLYNMKIVNKSGSLVEVDGYFMPKKSMEAGLEVADLVAHTAGRQRRHQIAGKEGHTLDFQHMYWHSPIPPAFMSIDNITLEEMVLNPTKKPVDE